MRRLVYIGLMGMVGAVLRVSIGNWIGVGDFPIATLLANLLATWLLCFFATIGLARFVKSIEWQEAITVGFLGSLSTFSAFSVETVVLLETGHWLLAIFYVMLSIVGGLWIGQLARKWGSV